MAQSCWGRDRSCVAELVKSFEPHRESSKVLTTSATKKRRTVTLRQRIEELGHLSGRMQLALRFCMSDSFFERPLSLVDAR